MSRVIGRACSSRRYVRLPVSRSDSQSIGLPVGLLVCQPVCQSVFVLLPSFSSSVLRDHCTSTIIPLTRHQQIKGTPPLPVLTLLPTHSASNPAHRQSARMLKNFPNPLSSLSRALQIQRRSNLPRNPPRLETG